MSDLKAKKLEKLRALQAQDRRKKGLPHLHGFPFYPWARTFFESRNQWNFLVGGNQISKSSSMIRKCIHWATEQELWPDLWRTKPNIFWYLYPSMDVADIEVRKKWVPEFLPRNEFKDDAKYGWDLIEERGKVVGIDFKSGITVYFKAYTQNAQVLQTGTVFAHFVDEELPIELFPELQFRLAATSGYYHAAFTATLGQDYWRQVMEDKTAQRPFPNALKLTISLYDCMYYEDGSPSFWTKEKIENQIAACPNQRVVDMRVFGKFVKAEGLRYPSFDRLKNVKKPPGPVPADWLVYGGVDLGSGGATGHPSAIVFIAVRPDFRKARLFKHWNGKGIDTTAADTFNMYVILRGKIRCVSQVYDYSSKDFFTIAARNGESFMPADKTVETGDNTLNSLFKHQILDIDDIPENFEVIRQFENLGIEQKKSKAVDDSCDATRYPAVAIPWDWSVINLTPEEKKPVQEKTDTQLRREAFVEAEDTKGLQEVWEEEISEWNDYYEV
jgi:hypothetical protein